MKDVVFCIYFFLFRKKGNGSTHLSADWCPGNSLISPCTVWMECSWLKFTIRDLLKGVMGNNG